MEKPLRIIIISLFVIVLLSGIYFAMSVNGPGLPENKQRNYMIKDNGHQVSCFFPFLGTCGESADEKLNQQGQAQ